MIHYNEQNQTFELRLKDSNLICYSMEQLQKQSKLIYKFDCLTLLN